MAHPHDWHLFDEEMGYEVRQTTDKNEDNCWELRDPEGNIVALNDEEFSQLRDDGPNPKGIK